MAIVNNTTINNNFIISVQRAKEMSYGDIEKSEGDIARINGYDNLVQSMILLREIQKRSGSKMEELDTIETALKNIEKFKSEFTKGFKIGDNLIILLYNNLVTAEIAATSFVISSCLDYLQNPNSEDYEIFVKSNKQNYNNTIIYFKNLSRFNKMCVSGEFSRILNSELSKTRKVSKDFLGAEAGIAIVLGVSLAISIIPLLQELVYQIYSSRISMADYLKTQSEFLELNQARLNDLEDKKKRKFVSGRQKQVAKRLMTLSDKIDVDVKASNTQAPRLISNDVREISAQTSANETTFDSGMI